MCIRDSAYAMHDMGKIYAQGIGCEADKEKADVWYKKALAAMHYVCLLYTSCAVILQNWIK